MTGVARPVAAGQDQPDRRALVAVDVRGSLVRRLGGDLGDPRRLGRTGDPDAVGQVGRRQGQDHVLAVAGHDDERPRPDPLEHVPRLHRPDRDAVDDPVQIRARVDRLALDALEDHPERRVRQDRPDRQHAEQADPVVRQPSLEDASRCPGWASRSTLFTIAPATGTPCAAKCEALRTISSIGRPTPPSLTMIAGAAEHRRDRRVREPDHRARRRRDRSPRSGASRCSPGTCSRAATIRAPRSSTTSPAM